MEDDKKIQSDLQPIFTEMSQVTFRVDPHLSTKVMARIRDRKSRTVPQFWKWMGLGSSGVAAALLVFVIYGNFQNPRYEAFVGKAFVVKLEVLDLAQSKVARAEIRLPDGVYFDIDQYPELKNQRQLTLAWSNRNQNEFIPFVLNSTGEGKRTVTVSFYDAENRLVSQKKLDIKLTKEVQKG